MGIKDTVTKEYMQNTEVFADAFNYLIYGGEQVIKPESLHELDTAEIVLPYGDDNKSEPVQKFRDVLKMATAMADENAAYLILGIENQTDIHYAMPVRNMLYDALQYTKQVSDAGKSHRNANNTGDTNAEYLSGFYKSDKLLPVITLVVYFGASEWDAPRTIRDMMLVKDERILAYTPDYRINLIAPQELSEEKLDKFSTDLRTVLKYIKFSKDKNLLNAALHNDEAFHSVPRQAAVVINTITNSQLEIKDGEESIDVCKAIEDMRNDAIQEGEAKGRAEGEAKGRAETLKEVLRNMIDSGIEESQAKKILGLT
ncbi:MAG: Rpn family recombination-promoting nuclease/putative transposase [Ruminococcus flavefaciens]|nr:Rpn family recombination-promoting nuclease/putative transposase [Ruminococcus flavefaciens]MCM1061236.1 Rpn family recombination-promoting nuclease/putative transposase [Eubacterium sp.]